MLRTWLSKVASSLRGRRVEDELETEIHAHLEMATEEHLRRGMSPEQARRAARRSFGGVDQIKERHRELRTFRWLDDLYRDVRLGTRSLGRSPAFALSAVSILALGIGASVALFGVLHAVVLRPLPYGNPDQLALVLTHNIAQNLPDGTSLPNFEDWRERSVTFAEMTYYRRPRVSRVTVSRTDGPRRIHEGLVAPNFFDVLGTPPLHGRTFSREEFALGERVVVLSEGLWNDRFGRSDDVVGETLALDGETHVVIGVMPHAFQIPNRDTRLWRPLSVSPWLEAVGPSRSSDGLVVIGRLRAGSGLDDAQAEMRVIAATLREAFPDENGNEDIRIVSLFDSVVEADTRTSLWLLFAAAVSLLLIACANVAGLLTARGSWRRQELAVRMALGAARGRVARQLLAEGLGLGVGAGILGLVTAQVALELVLTRGPQGLPRLEALAVDYQVLSFAMLAACVSVVLFGTVPALVGSAGGTREVFGDGSTARAAGRGLSDALVVGQISVTVVLLVGAVLMTQSWLTARAVDPGYPAKRLLVVSVDLPGAVYADDSAALRFHRTAAEAIQALPGIVASGAIGRFFIASNPDIQITVEGGRNDWADGEAPPINGNDVTPGYFRAMGVPLIAGRRFNARDLLEPGRVIINETMARRFWPGQDAVGRRFQSGDGPFNSNLPSSTIVGVVADMRRQGRDRAVIPSLFVPDAGQQMDLCVRTSIDVVAQTLIPTIRQAILELDDSIPITIESAEAHLSELLGERRLDTELFGTFAAIALFLAGAGLYALLSYQVAVRNREIGIRSALGATPRTLVMMVMGTGVRLTATGLWLGLAGAIALSRVLQTLLYDTAALSLGAYTVTALFVLCVGAAASALPTLRAASVNPVTTLRAD
jgi:putative ABC transport system permease protein